MIKQRGPDGPRLLVRLAPAALLGLLLGSCGYFGAGLAEFPSDSGWRPMPVASWIIEDAIRPQTIVFCPAESCPAPAMVAIFQVSGREADRLEEVMRRNPSRLFQKTATNPSAAASNGSKEQKLSIRRQPASQRPHPGSTIQVEALDKTMPDGLFGARVNLRSKAEDQRYAGGVVLMQRRGTELAMALSVTTDPDAALRHAEAGLRSSPKGMGPVGR